MASSPKPAAVSKPKQICYFTDRLSAELRLEIYKHVLRSNRNLRKIDSGSNGSDESESSSTHLGPSTHPQKIDNSILQANKVIYREAESVLYDVNTITADHVSMIMRNGDGWIDKTSTYPSAISDNRVVHLLVKYSTLRQVSINVEETSNYAQSPARAFIDRLRQMPRLRSLSIICEDTLSFQTVWYHLPQTGAKGLRVGSLLCVGWLPRLVLTEGPLMRGWADLISQGTRGPSARSTPHHRGLYGARYLAVNEGSVPFQLKRFFKRDSSSGVYRFKIDGSEDLAGLTVALVDWLAVYPRQYADLDGPVEWDLI